MSGEAFTRIQRSPSLEIAIEDWVRGEKPGWPLRTAAQLWQRQFHCGNPPPAAEPRILTSTAAQNLKRPEAACAGQAADPEIS